MAFSTFAALLPGFIDEWQLNKTEAGLLTSAFFAGYLISGPILSLLTDLLPVRRIYMMALLISAFSGLCFGWLAVGFWSALVLRFVGGIGLGGGYMPGLRALSDQVSGSAHSRAIAFYTSTFGVGASLSFYFSGLLDNLLGWRLTFILMGFAALLSWGLAWVWTPLPTTNKIDWKKARALIGTLPKILRNKRVMGYTWAYCFHNVELFGFRGWITTFLVFSSGISGQESWVNATTLTAILTLFGMPSSVMGNELALRYGRPQIVVWIMSISALIGSVVGFLAGIPSGLLVPVCIAYSFGISGDSSPITAGALGEVKAQNRGAAMAIHTLIGFVGSFLGPLIFGFVLDLTGGGQSAFSWGMGFASMSVMVALGPLCLIILHRLANKEALNALKI